MKRFIVIIGLCMLANLLPIYALPLQDPCQVTLSAIAEFFLEDIGESQKSKQFELWRLLDFISTRVPLKKDLSPKRILNLASGKGQESYLLSAYFGGGGFLNPSQSALVTAVDICDNEIPLAQQSKQRYASLAGGSDFVQPIEFKLGDATKEETFIENGGSFDFIVIRHPEVTQDLMRHPGLWRSILNNAANYLKPGGILIMTHYSEYEAQIAEGLLGLSDLDNLISKEANPEASSNDSFISVLKKPK